MKVRQIADFLDRLLEIERFPSDSSNNGLQVENSGEIRRICCGVDASMGFFREAAKHGAGLLICHHGISWGDSLRKIGGLDARKIKYLMAHDMALYACHLPLDAHPRYGNNILISRALGLKNLRKFGGKPGSQIAFAGYLPRSMPYGDFKLLFRKVAGNEVTSFDFGGKTVRHVAVVSGGGTGYMEEAFRLGADVFVSGEPSLSGYNCAADRGANAVFAGHYATEVFGVKALARLLARRFRLSADFIDMKIRV